MKNVDTAHKKQTKKLYVIGQFNLIYVAPNHKFVSLRVLQLMSSQFVQVTPSIQIYLTKKKKKL